jgi:hypothetical protein
MDNLFFKKYKELKENFGIQYKGYQLDGFMAKEFIYFAYKMQSHPVRGLKRSFIKSKLFYGQDFDDFKKLLSLEKVMFSFNNYGSDYNNLLKAIMDQVDEPILFEPNNNFKKQFNVFSIIVSFSQLFITSKLKSISVIDRFYFFLALVQYKNTINILEQYKGEVNTTKFVPFLSCLPVDSILCQFFRKHGVKSYGIQHGAHCSSLDYSNYIPYDVINIENIQSDYMLAWGSFIKEALVNEGKSEKQFILAGAPKYFNVKEIRMQSSGFKPCIVCFARDIYYKENIMLLEIVREMVEDGLTVHLKFHPRSDMKKYDAALNSFEYLILDLGSSIEESIAIVKPDFVIVYNSTVYYEYYMKGIIALRYGYNQSDIPFGLEDIFHDYSEIQTLFNTFKKINKEQLDIDVNAMISRFCSLGVNNYRKILN